MIDTSFNSSVKSSKPSAQPKNLAKSLGAVYSQKTPIEKATLSVVSIKTALGGGTGFFVSDTGYIVTNRHVVRPTTTGQWQKSNEKYQTNLDDLNKQKQNIDRRQKELDKMSKDLARYKQRVDAESGGIGSVARSDYRIFKNRHSDLDKYLKESIKSYQKNKKIVDKQKSDFNFSSTISRTVRHFEIRLKDNSTLHAELILLSKEHDLALLKLTGHITPFINMSNSVTPAQGSKAYAIGSPLGLSDFVTSGSITNVRRTQIITDTQILPGNSGGPLIDTKGRVIGVNTQKIMAGDARGSAGFGIAIPISIVNAEFGSVISQ